MSSSPPSTPPDDFSPGPPGPSGPPLDAGGSSLGLEVHVRDTVSAPADDVWEVLFHPQMMEAWLRTGSDEPEGGSPGPYAFAGGGDGSIKVLEIRRHVRLAWHPDGWPGPTTLDIRAVPEQGEEEADERTVVEFRQERVPGESEREARQAVLTAAMQTLQARLEEA